MESSLCHPNNLDLQVNEDVLRLAIEGNGSFPMVSYGDTVYFLVVVAHDIITEIVTFIPI